jgi:hypothetical protein
VRVFLHALVAEVLDDGAVGDPYGPTHTAVRHRIAHG